MTQQLDANAIEALWFRMRKAELVGDRVVINQLEAERRELVRGHTVEEVQQAMLAELQRRDGVDPHEPVPEEIRIVEESIVVTDVHLTDEPVPPPR